MRLLKSLATTSILLATGSAAAPSAPDCAPGQQNSTVNNASQYRLAYAGKGGMAISWNTPEQVNRPAIRYGRNPKRLRLTQEGHSSTYATSTTWSNHVKIKDLLPDTVYYYQVVNNGTVSNDVLNFTTAPQVGSRDEFTFAVVIDMGTMGPLGLSETAGKGAGGTLLPGERNTVDALVDHFEEFKFVWHPGDIAYADYWLKEEIQGYLPNTTIADGYKVYNSILNEFYNDFVPVSGYKPYMVGPGNHEANCDNGGTKDKANHITYTESICMPGQTNFTGYINHFNMPSQESGGKTNMWYSFDHGMVHFVQINTETDLGNGLVGPDEPEGEGKENAGPFGSYPNEQYDWLKHDLASVDRAKTPWVIVAGHRPWYLAADPGDPCAVCQDAFEDLFVEYNVDVAIFGHVHNYQRLNPVAHNVTDPAGLNNPKAPWYLLNGIAGHYDGMDSLVDEKPDYFVVGQDDTYGWSRFTVHNETHLTHEFVVSRNDTVFDTATLYKEHKEARKHNHWFGWW